MPWAQQNYPQQLSGQSATIAEAGSLLVALCNGLEQMTGQQVDPPTLNQFFTDIEESQLDWNSLSLYDPNISISELDSNNNTPPAVPALIRFNSISTLTAERIDYYCWVDHIEGEHVYIIDSWDGIIKPPGVYEASYGKPVAWATYKHVAPKISEDRTYVLGHKETLWDVARKLRVPAQELIDHNDIDKPHKIGEGDTLHIPLLPQALAEPEVTYQWFDEPQIYHIVNDKGATKWSFGNAKEWKHITATGPRYKKNTTVTIVGLAQVPLKDSEQPAGYHVDRVSAGDNYHTTGRPAYTTGYNWRDLKAGEPVVAAVPPSEQPVQDPPKPAPKPEKKLSPNAYKATFAPFRDGAAEFRVKPDILPTDSVRIYDYDRLKAIGWPVTKPFFVAGTFKREGKLYGRPAECVAAGTWYGFPWHLIEEVMTETPEEDELHNGNVSMKTHKLVLTKGRFSLQERQVSIPLAKAYKKRQNMVDLAYKIKQTLKDK